MIDTKKIVLGLALLALAAGLVAFIVHQAPVFSGLIAGSALVGTLASAIGAVTPGGGGGAGMSGLFGKKKNRGNEMDKNGQKPANSNSRRPTHRRPRLTTHRTKRKGFGFGKRRRK